MQELITQFKSYMGGIGRLINSMRSLNIPRLEDLPYNTSPPVQFVYESTANLSVGVYTWSDVPSTLTPSRPLIDNAVYLFRTITLFADIDPLDFSNAIIENPSFYTFLVSDSEAPLFREPILMPYFIENFDYRFILSSQQGSDELKAAWRGSMLQTNALLGKSSITLKAIISAQEIVDENYIDLFKSKYPTPPEDVRIATDNPSVRGR